jgi:hypothetical protein
MSAGRPRPSLPLATDGIIRFPTLRLKVVPVQAIKAQTATRGTVPLSQSGFGGIAVSMLASGTQDRGLEPGRSRRIFRAKKSTACIPSEGK